MVGWHHRLRGHEFEQAPREWYRTGKPGALQARKESDTTERLNSHKSTGNGRDLVGRQRPEMSAVPPPQPTGRRHSRISADRQLGRPPAQHTKARTQMQTARSLLPVGCGHSPRAGPQGGEGRPAGHRDTCRCSIHTESQGRRRWVHPRPQGTRMLRVSTLLPSGTGKPHGDLHGQQRRLGWWGQSQCEHDWGTHSLNNKPHCRFHCLQPEKSVLVAQSCPTLCDLMGSNLPPVSSVCGNLQARTLEWGAMPFTRGSSLNQGSNLGLPALQADSSPSGPPGKPMQLTPQQKKYF